MLYTLVVLMKSVLRKRDNAVLMFLAICVLIWGYECGYSQFYIDRKHQFVVYVFVREFCRYFVNVLCSGETAGNEPQKLILYNEKLIEADKLKDKIMATEMSFCKLRSSRIFSTMHSAQLPTCVKRRKAGWQAYY